MFRLPAADNQAKVRFRFAHAGTDSWYFGVDNFGLYSLPSAPQAPPQITGIARTGPDVVISWNGEPGVKLQKSASLISPNWQDVAGTAGASSFTETAAGTQTYYRLAR